MVALFLAVLAWAGALTPCAAGPWSTMLDVPKAGVVVAGAAGSSVYGFDAQSGQMLWRHAAESPNNVHLLTDGETVFLVHERGVKAAQALHHDPTLVVEALDGRTGAPRWRNETWGTLQDEPLLLDGHVVLASTLTEAPGGRVTGLDAATGSLAWTHDDGSVVALVGAVATLFTVSKADDGIVLSRIDPKNGTLAWQPQRLAGTLERRPALIGGTVVVLMRTPQGVSVTGAPADPGHAPYVREFNDVAYDHVGLQGGRIVARSIDGKTLVVYNAETGAPVCTLRPAQAAADKGLCAVPVVDGDTIYVAAIPSADQFTVLAYDAATGAERAHTDMRGQLESPLTALPSGLWFGVAVPTSEEKTTQLLVGLGGRDLSTRRTVQLDSALDESGPTEVASPRGPMVLVKTPNGIIGIDPRTADSVFEAEADMATPPLLAGHCLFFGDNDMNLTVYDLAAPARPLSSVNTKAWFNTGRVPNLLFVGIIVGLLLWFIRHARRDSNLFIRRLPGLSALDDAVGRATEMGKPVLYVCGTQDVDEMETLAGLSILGHVAKRAAEYETPLLMPTSRSVVMSTAQEVVREAHFKAGRPDSYQQDNIRYLTDDQFGYVAGVDGIMMREKPAANFFMGMFFGESLILAETGHSTGAIQIAGTAQASQLPFFVAACDYTLMGEELFAASAYLSRDPREVGSLKGQDYVKALIMTVILLASIAYPWVPQVKTWLSQ